MRKIIALWQNEMIKTFKKVSIIILTALLIPGIFGIGGFFKLVEYMNNRDYSTVDTQWRQQELESFRDELAEYEKELEGITSEDAEYTLVLDKLYSMKEAIIIRKLCNEFELATYYSNNWLNNAINDYANAISDIERNTVHEPGYLTDDELQYQTERLKLKEIIDKKEYKKYIEFRKKEIETGSLNDFDKQFELDALDYTFKCDPEGINESYTIEEAISKLRDYKRSLEYKINYLTSPEVPLSVSQEAEFKNATAALEYKLNNGLIKPSPADGQDFSFIAVPGMISTGAAIILILLIILAGGSISQEMSSGSIKSLIISPTKRWKIFCAKYLSVLTVGIGASIIAAILTVISTLVLFGTDALSSYVYAINGVPYEMNGVIYIFAQQLVELIEVMIFASFAFMLSIVTRNTAASVCVSVVIYFLGSIATGVLGELGISGEWTKFIPFNNTSMLATQFFPYSNLNNVISELTVSSAPTLTFSLIYICVLMICILYTAFDSFTRRDI